MSLTIKASLYHNWNHHPIETRRFSIDQEVATSFTYLMQKLAQIFPDVEADKITVAYIGMCFIYACMHACVTSIVLYM